MDKLLSISIAAYNVAACITETLDTLITDKDVLNKIQVIIVNDGSKDKTAEIVSEYCTKYPDSFFLINKQNGGYGSTINTALKIANGKYFRLLDGDDWYFTENLKAYITFLEQTDADIVLTPYVEYYENNGAEKLLNRQNLEPLKEYWVEEIKSSELTDIKMHELASKTSIMKKHGIQITEHCFYTDTEYAFLNFFYAKSVVKFDLPIYKYRIGRSGQSVSVEGRLKHSEDAGRVLDKIITLFETTKDELHGVKKQILWNTIKMNAEFQYTTYLLFEKNEKNVERIKRYDEKLRQISESLYRELPKQSKAIRLLRLTRYRGYGLIRKIMINRMAR